MAMAESWRCASGSNPPIITAVSLAHHSDISSIPTYHKTQLKTRKKRKVYTYQQQHTCMPQNTAEEKQKKESLRFSAAPCLHVTQHSWTEGGKREVCAFQRSYKEPHEAVAYDHRLYTKAKRKTPEPQVAESIFKTTS